MTQPANNYILSQLDKDILKIYHSDKLLVI